MQNSVRPFRWFPCWVGRKRHERFLQIGHTSIGGSNTNEYGKFIECLGGAKSEKDRHHPRKREHLVRAVGSVDDIARPMVSVPGLQAWRPHRLSLAELDRNGEALFCMLQGRDDRCASERTAETARDRLCLAAV